jgi:protoporphyrinogen oxidase
LVEKFLYPSKGPGMLWDKVAEKCTDNGVTIIRNAFVTKIELIENEVKSIDYENSEGQSTNLKCSSAFSTMPLKNLFNSIHPAEDSAILETSRALEYRDFFIVGLLLTELKFEPENGGFIKDNWLYIQDKGVSVGRLQIFNNWSPYMVDSDNVWIGAEYFCNETDDIWKMKDEDLTKLALSELEQIGILDSSKFLDSKVVRCPKAYPSYTGAYSNIDTLQSRSCEIVNLYPMGRNGLHKYNNQDHSMLTAFKAVEIHEGNGGTIEDIWNINSDQEYHEEITETKDEKLSKLKTHFEKS